jgi:hypothetical protein
MAVCFQNNSSFAEDRKKYGIEKEMSPSDREQVATFESLIAMELMLEEGMIDIVSTRYTIDQILSKYMLPNISTLRKLMFPTFKSSIAPYLAVCSKQMIETCYYSDSESDESVEENLAVQNPEHFVNELAQLIVDYKFKVKYMGTTFEFDTYPEATKFADDRNVQITSFSQSELIVGGVRTNKRPKRGRKPRRTNARKRNVGNPLPQARQEGQINTFIPRPRDAIVPIVYNGNLTADAAGLVSARFSVRNPRRAFNGSGDYVNNFDFGTTFDKYRPNFWVFQFTPTSPVQAGSLATAFDWDAPDSSTPNYANTINYAIHKQFVTCKPFTEMSKVPYLTEGTIDTDEARPAVIHQNGFLDFAKPPVQGQFYFNAQQCTPLSNVGTFVLTMVLQIRARR